MMDNIDGLRFFREGLFKTLGNKRWKRILVVALFIALIWIFADWISGSYEPILWHDLICIFLAVVVERLLPWGKVTNS